MKYATIYFAQAYGEGAYSTSTYQDGSTSTGGGTTGTTAAGSAAGGKSGVLTDTGFDILVIATIACAVVFVALVVRFWRKPSKKTTA